MRDLPKVLGALVGSCLGAWIVGYSAMSRLHLYSVRVPSAETLQELTPLEGLQLLASVESWPRSYDWPMIAPWGVAGVVVGGYLGMLAPSILRAMKRR